MKKEKMCVVYVDEIIIVGPDSETLEHEINIPE